MSQFTKSLGWKTPRDGYAMPWAWGWGKSMERGVKSPLLCRAYNTKGTQMGKTG